MELPLRTKSISGTNGGDNGEYARPTDIPSLLFYYIFDDWAMSYSLVARREHRYSAELENLVSTTGGACASILTGR